MSSRISKRNSKHISRQLQAAMLAVLSTSAYADGPAYLDEVVVTGTKFDGAFGEKSGIAIEKMPQSVQIISADDIADLGATSVGDLLRTVPSADPGYSRVGPWQSFSLKVRGFLADQMRNGIRQRYYEDVDASALSNIERVEVLKGPSGVLYGQSAVGGIVSIVTKRPTEAFAASIEAGIGSFNQKTLSVDLNGGIGGGLSARLTGEIERSDTFVDFQPMDRNNVALNLTYSPNDSIAGHLVYEYVERDTQRYPGLPLLGTVQHNGVGTLDNSLHLGEPAFTDLHAFAPLVQAWVDVKLSQHWTLTPRFQYQQFNTTFGEVRVRDPQTGSTTVFNRTGRYGVEDDNYNIAQLDLAGEFSTGSVGHRLLVGYEYEWERSRFAQSNLTNLTPIDVLAPVYTYNSNTPALAFAYDNFYNVDGDAIYLQDLMALTERLDAVAAIRHTWFDASDGPYGGAANNQAKVTPTIWNVGLTYRFNDVVSAYTGYNTGFDIESTAGGRTKDGTPLDPEESQQFELGLRVKANNLRGSVALFQIERVNVLTADPNDPDYVINSGEQRARGVEVEGEWFATDNFMLSAGYAYLDGEVTKSNDGDQGGRIGGMAEHTVNARASYRVPGTGLSLRGGVVHVTDRALVNGSSVLLPSYTLADVSASYQVGKWSFVLFARNVFDEQYYSASGNRFVVIPGDPLTFEARVGVKW